MNTGMCLPCCSSAAIGKITGVVFGSAATAGHERSVSSMSDVPAGSGGGMRNSVAEGKGLCRVRTGCITLGEVEGTMTKKPTKYIVTDGEMVLTLEVAEEGGYTVTSPFMKGLVTEADTLEEAFEMARDAAAGLNEVRAGFEAVSDRCQKMTSWTCSRSLGSYTPPAIRGNGGGCWGNTTWTNANSKSTFVNTGANFFVPRSQTRLLAQSGHRSHNHHSAAPHVEKEHRAEHL